MKFLLTGDWHIRLNAPKNRIDDYWSAQVRKLKFISGLFKEHDCYAILQPGDMFDSFKANDLTKRETILLFKRLFPALTEDFSLFPTIYTVFGQHDLKHHSLKNNTPMGILQAADLIEIIDPIGIVLEDETPIRFYGASWGEEIPETPAGSPEINILLVHAFITEEPEIGVDKYYTTNNLLKGTHFDLIVSGDNHKSFVISEDEDRHIVNCGSLMRSAIDQKNHVPCVYIYDTEDMSLQKFDIPIEPFSSIFNIKEEEKIRERNESLEIFIEGLSKKLDIQGLDFNKNVKGSLKDLSKGGQNLVREAMRWKISNQDLIK